MEAHELDDKITLVRLYTRAGDMADKAGNVDQACFFLTHAYVFALETGAPSADALHARLKAHGRDE
ncbi:MAG: hypothetical protein AAF334_09905 [Pseudomonadota bacterium]